MQKSKIHLKCIIDTLNKTFIVCIHSNNFNHRVSDLVVKVGVKIIYLFPINCQY